MSATQGTAIEGRGNSNWMWMELQRENPRPSRMGGVIKNAEGAIVTTFSRQPVLGDSNRHVFFQLGRAQAPYCPVWRVGVRTRRGFDHCYFL